MKFNNGIFSTFPEPGEILSWHKTQQKKSIPDINAHIHTPYSFSGFSDIEQAFLMAKKEGVSVLGINDFYTSDGYDEFAEQAQKHKIFPLFNIEFMALQTDLQKAGIRVNDPNNPGRTYICGKGLRQPVKMSDASLTKLLNLQKESNKQTFLMIEKLNSFFAERKINIQLDAVEVQKKLAKNLLRERHIAQAVRLAVFKKEITDLRRAQLFNSIFQGKKINAAIDDIAGLENEIRTKLLKAGSVAYVTEQPKAFLSIDEVKTIIIDAGGIPCYPLLLDFNNGSLTEFEANKEKLLQELIKNEIYCIEIISTRNSFELIKEYVTFFNKNNFIITFGSEHNSPKLTPLKLNSADRNELDNKLKTINYEGAAIIAAHQYLIAKGKDGYLNEGKAKLEEKEYFVELGKAVIERFLS